MHRYVLVSMFMIAGTLPADAATIYWNLFNIEGESDQSTQYVTYGSLNDMLLDVDRTGLFTPNSIGFGKNIVGSGAFSAALPTPVPLPAGLWLLIGGIGALFGVGRLQKDRRVPVCS
jgi:hypothetical protein